MAKRNRETQQLKKSLRRLWSFTLSRPCYFILFYFILGLLVIAFRMCHSGNATGWQISAAGNTWHVVVNIQ